MRNARLVRAAHDRVEPGPARGRLRDHLSRRQRGQHEQRDRATKRHRDRDRSLPRGDMVPFAVKRRTVSRSVAFCDPTGNRGGSNITGTRRVTALPTEPPAVVRPEATSGCNECNEALDMARELLAKTRRLALVVQNALLNADLQRACSVLQELEIATSIDVCAGRSLQTLYG